MRVTGGGLDAPTGEAGRRPPAHTAPVKQHFAENPMKSDLSRILPGKAIPDVAK